jgi:hypothetical protein
MGLRAGKLSPRRRAFAIADLETNANGPETRERLARHSGITTETAVGVNTQSYAFAQFLRSYAFRPERFQPERSQALRFCAKLFMHRGGDGIHISVASTL